MKDVGDRFVCWVAIGAAILTLIVWALTVWWDGL